MPSIIEQETEVTTLINVFTVEPEHQQRVLDILIESTTGPISKLPGFISANFHASKDGTRVVNYAQWDGPDAWKAMLADPECKEHITEVLRYSTTDYDLYDVVSVHAPDLSASAATP